jgi:Protein of unknown function (DUF616)
VTSRIRTVVYTVLFGDYEDPQVIPDHVASETNADFVMVCDRPRGVDRNWSEVIVEPDLPLDFHRSQRMYKLDPHRLFPAYDRALYIDNSVRLTAPLDPFIDNMAAHGSFATLHHSFRATVADEFHAIAGAGFDDGSRIWEQFNAYQWSRPEVLTSGARWGGVLFWDLRDERTAELGRIWRNHVLRYSRRDQLSIEFAIAASGIETKPVVLDNYKTDYFVWPSAIRHVTPTMSLSLASIPSAEKVRLAELQTTEISQRAAELSTEIAILKSQLGEAKSSSESQVVLLASQASSKESQAQQLESQAVLLESRSLVVASQAERLDAQVASLELLHSQLSAIETSTAWRATGPFRALLDLAKARTRNSEQS